MSNAIYYQDNQTGHCYKVDVETEDEAQIDAILDIINNDNTMITKEKFDDEYVFYMKMDLFDATNSFKIGTITTRLIDLDEKPEAFNL